MELTASAQQADRQTTTRQTKERKEDASSSHSKLECQDYASWLIELSSTDQRLKEDSHIDSEEDRLNIDIATLQETGSLKEQRYRFFWQGNCIEEKREHGVGFAVKNSLLKKKTERTLTSTRQTSL